MLNGADEGTIGPEKHNIVLFLPGGIEVRHLLYACATAVTLAAGCLVPARADVIERFDATGQFTDGSVLAGFLDIDVTDGLIVGSDLTTTGPSAFEFVNIVNQSDTQVPGDHNVGDRSSTGTEDFNFDIPGNLFGYQGSIICSNTSLCHTVSSGVRSSGLFDLTTNSDGASLVTGALTAPEPATLTIIGAGLVGLAAARRKRRS